VLLPKCPFCLLAFSSTVNAMWEGWRSIRADT
jgi:hypothetical protein